MSTDILDRIDATIAAWEAAPESWVPGDPLYERPGCVVRRMYSIIDDAGLAGQARCEPCQVRWAGPEPCWMCGTERPALGTAVVYTAPISAVPLTFFSEVARASRDMEAAMERFRVQIATSSAPMVAALADLSARLERMATPAAEPTGPRRRRNR